MKYCVIVRVDFIKDCGSESNLFALDSLDDLNDCIAEYIERRKVSGMKFDKILDDCVMTPLRFVKEPTND